MDSSDQIECDCTGLEHCPYLWDVIQRGMVDKGPQLQHFLELVKERYPGCTREQQLIVYLQHHPNRAVPLLKELLDARDLRAD